MQLRNQFSYKIARSTPSRFLKISYNCNLYETKIEILAFTILYSCDLMQYREIAK